MLDISCAFATSMATPDHVAHAEALGFRRAWLYDSPALYPDVWMTLAECARRTSTIELGPGVAIPSLRHPMVTAAAVATLCDLAPGRVNLAIGSGFTGRLTLGQKPLPWAYVREYVVALVELLGGGTPLWDGARIRMLHPDGFGARRPIRIPIILGTGGPKGEAVARDLADGIFATSPRPGFARCSVLTFGTVLDDGEDAGSARCPGRRGPRRRAHVPRPVSPWRGEAAAERRGVGRGARSSARRRAAPRAARGTSDRGKRARSSRGHRRDVGVVRPRSRRRCLAGSPRVARGRRRDSRSRISRPGLTFRRSSSGSWPRRRDDASLAERVEVVDDAALDARRGRDRRSRGG